MSLEGRIDKITNDQGQIRFVVDAEPYVMSKIRKLFDNATIASFFYTGKYTHKPISFPDTMSACKDLLWIMHRFNFDISKDLLEYLKQQENKYDQIINHVSNADKDSIYKISKNAIPLAFPLREYQVQFLNMFNKINKMLLADQMGLGKTPQAISTLQEPESRPAIVIVPSHLCSQWERELNKFLPGITTHVIRGFKNYPLPKVDVIITSYNRLSPWQDLLINKDIEFKTVIFDEIHELRHTGTAKRDLSSAIAKRSNRCLGLSGTPIYNYGNEIWSVMDVINPGCLGRYEEFSSEWCDYGGKIREPMVLNNFMKKQGLLLRRTSEDIGLKFGEASKFIYTIDADLEKLKEVKDIAKMLALSVLSGNIGEDSDAAREFDYKLRHATGVAKARPTAEFVKMLLEEEEKIVLVGWHRDVYDVWINEFKDIKTVLYTGSESTKEKEESIKEFIEGDARLFIISLRSGAGIDGLQRVCNTMVFGELDWSPHVMDQVVARLDRDGQGKHVNAYYLTIADGSDPYMIQVLGTKRSQHEGLIEGKSSQGLLLDQNINKNRVREMAASYLKSIGEEIPEAIKEDGLLGELTALIRRFKLPTNSEQELQESIDSLLRPNTSAIVEKEYKLSKRSRLDFLVHNDKERVGIECKIDSTKRSDVYRQVRRYIQEGQITSLILIAPWHGIPSFKVDSVRVIVIDININSI